MRGTIMLVTRPRYDDATYYLFCYAELVIKEAEERGIAVLDLKRPRLTRQNFTNMMMNDKPPLFVFFNAHGNEKAIYGDKVKTGEDEEILVEEGRNHHLLNSKMVYARACWSAASLGWACRNGCFIGYKMPFGFWMNEKWSTNPLNDNAAKLFLEPSNLIASSLLKGSTAEEAVDKSRNLSKKNILKLLKEKEEPGAMASIMVLWSNMESLEILGNRDMRLG